jgi:hypothetical protein
MKTAMTEMFTPYVHTHCGASLRTFLAFVLIPLSVAAQTKPKPTLADALLDARSPLVLAGGLYSGPGAEVLTTAIVESRFVLLGEDHGTREIPQFASALCDLMHPDAYAVEAGPEAARFVNSLLRSPDRGARMAERGKDHPNNMAFLDIREENDLAAHCATASRNPQFALWGLDQEFVGSAATLLDAMLATQPGPLSLASIAATQAQERDAEHMTRTSGDPGKLFLLASTDAETKPLEDAVAVDGNTATKTLLGEFTVSRMIYRLNAQGSPDSNRLRAELIKQHFLADYSAAKAQSPHMHVLLKFGDDHLGKGFNILHQRDMGNFIAELADGEGARSLHILVLGARGTHAVFTGYAKPLGHEPFVLADDPEYKWLAPAIADQLPQRADGTGTTLTLFDLRKLRFRGIDLPRDWERIVYSYDLFVLIPELSPASPIE